MQAAGSRLGVYEIVAPIGAGGMGEVYRARDTKLGRDVAIKVLPSAFTADPDRLARFEREARVLATLNHPHIATIYGVEESDGVRALVLELVEGETLSERAGPMPVDVAIRLAAQIADALDAAHDKGIVHRDLKPANLKLSPDGAVKVLDFGLAKLDSKADEATDTRSPTVALDDTRDGIVLGTAAYMSPEQARGQRVDKRTDIWAFGCVLYEMLTGRSAFGRETLTDTLAAVLDREPDWTRLPEATPPAVRRLLDWCLQKDLKRRLRDIGDAAAELDRIAHTPAPSTDRRHTTRTLWAWVVAGLASAVASAASVAVYQRPSSIPHPLQFGLVLDRSAYADLPRVAPDGDAIVYVGIDPSGRKQLWLRRLDSEDATPIAGTDDALYPFWSPDGRQIGFYAQRKLKRISREGGSPQTIVTLAAFDGTAAWSGTHEVVYAPGNRTPLYRVSDAGGEPPKAITKLDATRAENSHRLVRFLPDGTHFIFSARSANRENNALYYGSLDSGEVRRIGPIQSNVAYVPPRDGHDASIVFVDDGVMYQQRFDGVARSGEPVRLNEVAYRAISMQGSFDVSLNGRVMLYAPPYVDEQRLTWFDRKGVRLGTLGAAGTYLQPKLAPDGSRVVFNRPDDNGGNRDLWLVEAARGTASRLTVTSANEWGAVWAADGRAITFASDRNGARDGSTWVKSSMDPGAGERPVEGLPEWANPEDVSTDGKWIVFSNGAVHGDVWVAPTFGDRKPFRFFESGFEDRIPRISPDGRWIAYHSNETGRFEVYVRPFDGKPAESGRKIRLSLQGGYYATWSRNGRELFFLGPDSKIYSVPVTGLNQDSSIPAPQPLFLSCAGTRPTGSSTQGSDFDVAPDGLRFVFACNDEPTSKFRVTLDWLARR